MRNFLYFLLLSHVLTSCSSNSAQKALKEDKVLTIQKDDKRESLYSIKDSGYFWNELDEGKFLILEFKDKTIDSIDTYFGVYSLKNKDIVYLKVSKDKTDDFDFKKDTVYGSTDKYIILKKGSKKSLKDLTLYFDDYFSSPIFKNDKIYFWGIDYNEKTNLGKIYATEYNLLTSKTKQKFLIEDDLATDFRGYFKEPYENNDKIIFEHQNKKWVFNKEFQ